MGYSYVTKHKPNSVTLNYILLTLAERNCPVLLTSHSVQANAEQSMFKSQLMYNNLLIINKELRNSDLAVVECGHAE